MSAYINTPGSFKTRSNGMFPQGTPGHMVLPVDNTQRRSYTAVGYRGIYSTIPDRKREDEKVLSAGGRVGQLGR